MRRRTASTTIVRCCWCTSKKLVHISFIFGHDGHDDIDFTRSQHALVIAKPHGMAPLFQCHYLAALISASPFRDGRAFFLAWPFLADLP